MNARIRIIFLVLSLSCFTLCSLLQAAPSFEVSESSLDFGQLPPSQPKTLNFKVVNPQSSQVILNVSRTGSFLFAISFPGEANFNIPGQLIVFANQAKEVRVTYPIASLQACAVADGKLIFKSGTEEHTVSLHGELKCPELSLIGTAPQLSLQNGIKVQFGVINTGNVESLKTKGEIRLDGTVVHSFTIPPLVAGSIPNNQTQFEHIVTPVQPGTHTIEVRVDTINVNIEGIEGNNAKAKTITVP